VPRGQAISVSPPDARGSRSARAPPAPCRRRGKTPARRRAGPSRPAHNGFAAPRLGGGREASGEVCPNGSAIGTATPAQSAVRDGALGARGAKTGAAVVRYFLMKASFIAAAVAASLMLAEATAPVWCAPPSDSTATVRDDARTAGHAVAHGATTVGHTV